jgi:hypothetical protein
VRHESFIRANPNRATALVSQEKQANVIESIQCHVPTHGQSCSNAGRWITIEV